MRVNYMSSTQPQLIDSLVDEIFPKNEYDTEIIIDRICVVVRVADKLSTNLKTVFFVYDDHIFVTALNKFSNISGTNLLAKIELFSKKMGISQIWLDDASEMITNCGVTLFLYELFILSSGITWYNKLKYMFHNQEERETHNKRMIEKNMSEFIEMIHERIRDDSERIDYEDLIIEMKEERMIQFNSTVKRFFSDAIEITKQKKHAREDEVLQNDPEWVFELQLKKLLAYITKSRLMMMDRGEVRKTLKLSGGTSVRTKKRRNMRRKHSIRRSK